MRSGPYDRSLWIEREVGLWETANLFVSRELFDRVGGFEDWLRPVAGKAMAEDVWFGWRAKRTARGPRSAPRRWPTTRCSPAEPASTWLSAAARAIPGDGGQHARVAAAFLYRRVFLNHRTAALDAALVGAAAGLVLRRPGRW